MINSAKRIYTDRPTLFVVSFVMFVNALSYGTIIPLLYEYASRFGLNSFAIGLLFASFSLFQFISTPIIGRLSDKFGRKPLLLLSVLGTSISFAVFASAQTVWMLFLGRILDGITGGNIAVAQATIADTHVGKARSKAFGVLWSVFGLGFAVGPAFGGLLSSISITFPFWAGSIVALINTILILIVLRETYQPQRQSSASGPIIDIKGMIASLSLPQIGNIFFITFLIATGLDAFVIGFQAYSVETLRLNPTTIGLLFSGFGLVSFIVRAIGIGKLIRLLGSETRVVMYGSLLSAIFIFPAGLTHSLPLFSILVLLLMASRAPLKALLPVIVSHNSSRYRQGKMIGIQQSYNSLGKVTGPILAGIVASYWLPGVFIVVSALFFGGFILAYSIQKGRQTPIK